MTTAQAAVVQQGIPGRPAWLDPAEFPFASRYVEIDGNLIHYVDEGEGPVLLLVPGGVWSFVFRDLIARLKSDFRCITFDFPGLGLSKARVGYEPTIEANFEVLAAFVDRLGIHDIGLFLSDAGGAPALGLAARQPDRFRGIAIAATFAWPLDEHPSVKRALRFVGGPVFGALDDAFDVLGRFTATSRGAGKNLSSAGRAVLRGPWQTVDGRRAVRRMLRGLVDSDAWMAGVERATQTILRHKPVLTIFGERNDPFDWQDRYDRTFARTHRLTIPAGNHFPFADDPAAVADAVRRWWRELVIRTDVQSASVGDAVPASADSQSVRV